MTWDQYWYGPTWMVGQFRDADKLRQERQNTEAWLQGIYMARAISSTIGNAFLPKGSEPDRYPEQPFDIYGTEDVVLETEEQRESREEQEAVWALAWMTNFVEAGKNWGK